MGRLAPFVVLGTVTEAKRSQDFKWYVVPMNAKEVVQGSTPNPPADRSVDLGVFIKEHCRSDEHCVAVIATATRQMDADERRLMGPRALSTVTDDMDKQVDRAIAFHLAIPIHREAAVPDGVSSLLEKR